MAVAYHYSDPESELLVWKMEEPLSFFYDAVELLPEEKVQMENFKSGTRKLEFVAARFLLHKLFKEPISILYHTNGKPQSINGNQISISHCKGYVSAMRVKKGHPGIDVECINPRTGKIKHKYLNAQELAFAGDEEGLLTLFWSAKEALFKMCIKQGIDFKEHLCIHPSKPLSERMLVTTIEKEGRVVKIPLMYVFLDQIVLVWGINYEDI